MNRVRRITRHSTKFNVGCLVILFGLNYFIFLFLNNFKLVLACKTNRTLPIIGDVFKCCTGRDSTIGIADFRVINIPTGNTSIFFHAVPPYNFYNLAITLPKSTASFCASTSGFHWFLYPSKAISKPALAINSFITFTDSPLQP